MQGISYLHNIATDSVDSRNFLSVKKSTRKSCISCSIVSSDSATFVTCSQLWCWWSQIKQVISAPWRPTTPCCLFPCTKMVKFFPFKGNKSWCSFWDRHRGQIQNKIAKWRQLIILLLVVGAFHFTTQVVRIQ